MARWSRQAWTTTGRLGRAGGTAVGRGVRVGALAVAGAAVATGEATGRGVRRVGSATARGARRSRGTAADPTLVTASTPAAATTLTEEPAPNDDPTLVTASVPAADTTLAEEPIPDVDPTLVESEPTWLDDDPGDPTLTHPGAGPRTDDEPIAPAAAAEAGRLAVAEREWRPRSADVMAIPAAAGALVGQRRRRPLPARARQPERPASAPEAERVPAAAGPAIAPARSPLPRRDGVVVPLRPPWTTRLRATFGLLFMVAFLGATTALLIAAVAVAAAQALSRF